MSDTENRALNHVACEACRMKKCKCNRVLPICGQCDKSGTQCTYPQTFKRGFPEGYLAGIELRLAETERALFEAFSLRQNVPNVAPMSLDQVFDFKQNKSARMKEWERLPLTTVQERLAWFADKTDRVGLSFQTQTLANDGTAVMELNSPLGGSNLRTAVGNIEDMHILPWQQPQLPIASSPMTRHSPLDHIPYQYQHHSVSDMPTGSSWQPESSPRRPSISNSAAVSPQGQQTTTKAEILSVKQSRKFF